MIDENSYSSYNVENNLDKKDEYWDDEFNDTVIFYEFDEAMRDIWAEGGIFFPNIQNIITDLYENSSSGNPVDIAIAGETTISLVPSVCLQTYEEAVNIDLGLEIWSGPDADGYSHGGEALLIEMEWRQHYNPATESETRKILRWLYDQLQNEWHAAYDEWCERSGIGR